MLLLGFLASETSSAEVTRGLLAKTKRILVCTCKGAGDPTRELFGCTGGRIGLFHTQPVDHLLDAADLVVTVGYDPIEYEIMSTEPTSAVRI